MGKHEQTGKSDEWYTPRYIFDALGEEFDQDVAAPVDRTFVCTPAREFITRDGVVWKGFVWCNPPFGARNSIRHWLIAMSFHGNGIALTPDRTSAPWWQKTARECDAMLFIGGKVKFIKSDGTIGKSPANGTTLFAYGDRAVTALKRAAKNRLGIYTTKVE